MAVQGIERDAHRCSLPHLNSVVKEAQKLAFTRRKSHHIVEIVDSLVRGRGREKERSYICLWLVVPRFFCDGCRLHVHVFMNVCSLCVRRQCASTSYVVSVNFYYSRVWKVSNRHFHVFFSQIRHAHTTTRRAHSELADVFRENFRLEQIFDPPQQFSRNEIDAIAMLCRKINPSY